VVVGWHLGREDRTDIVDGRVLRAIYLSQEATRRVKDDHSVGIIVCSALQSEKRELEIWGVSLIDKLESACLVGELICTGKRHTFTQRTSLILEMRYLRPKDCLTNVLLNIEFGMC